MDAFLHDLPDHRCRIGNAGTLDNLVGIQDLFFRMLTLFPLNMTVVEHLLILICNLRHVGHEHIEAFFLSKDGSSSAALSCT